MANNLKVANVLSIQALHAQGWSQRRIARELGIHRETVSRQLRVAEAARDSKPAKAPTGSEELAESSKPAKAPTGSRTADRRPKPAKAPTGSPDEMKVVNLTNE